MLSKFPFFCHFEPVSSSASWQIFQLSELPERCSDNVNVMVEQHNLNRGAQNISVFPTFVLSPGTVILGLDVCSRLPDCRRPEPRDSEAIKRVSPTGRSPKTHSQDMHGILLPYLDSIAQPN